MTSKMYWAVAFLVTFSIGKCIGDDKRALVAECDSVCKNKIQLDKCCQRHGHIRGFGCSMYNKALCLEDDAYATCFKEKGQSNARIAALEKALEAAIQEHKAYVESMEKKKKGEGKRHQIAV